MSSSTQLSPPSPTRRGIYYGWAIVIVASLVMTATLPGRTHGLGIITKEMLSDIGLSTLTFGWINFAATLLGATFCIPCGWIIDRGGLRWLVGGTVAALGLVVCAMTRATDPVSLAVLVTLTRGLGQSMLSVISITMVARWFQRRLGPAMGIYCVVMSILLTAATIGLMEAQNSVGWRSAWNGQGVILLVMAPILFYFTSSAPRDRAVEFTTESRSTTTVFTGNTLADALISPCFWVFALSISLFGMIHAGLSLFQEFILEERGFGRSEYQMVMGIGLLIGMVSNLLFGWLSRRIDLRVLLGFAMFCYAGAMAGFPLVVERWHLVIYAFMQGAAGGMISVLFFAAWGKYFPGLHLGRIQGAAQMLTVFASAMGPIVFELAKSGSGGSYMPVFFAAAIGSLLLGVAAILTPLPQYHAGSEAYRLAV